MKKLTAVLICLLFLFLETKADNPHVKSIKEPEWITKKTYSYNNTSLDQQGTDGVVDLVVEDQINLQLKSVYHRRVFKILSEAGVQDNSEITINFDPSYQELNFHTIQIIRDNQVINQLDLSKINTVHQEKDLQKFIYNGTLTAVMILEDVRKGDIIEYSYTKKGFNPIFKNKYADALDFQFGVPVYNIYYKLFVPAGRSVTLKNLNTHIEPIVKQDASGSVYEWNSSNIEPLSLQDNVPVWYNPYATVLISEYKSWKEVNDRSRELFPFNIPISTELNKKIALIEKSNSTPEKKILATLRFVQDDIRYMGIEMGVNSHKPHSPDQIFHQRFGDCKDKSYLLCTMLRKMNIQADPILISTDYKGTLFNLLPSLTSFDHTTVRVRLNNKDYFFDPTISYQRGTIDNIFYPDYKAGLVVNDTTTTLTTIPTHLSKEEVREVFNVPNMNGAADMIVTTKYTGSNADDIRSYFKTSSYDEIKKDYVKFYSPYFNKIKADSISMSDNEETGEFTTREYYHINEFWGTNATKLKASFAPFVINSLIKKPKETERNMPFSITYPEKYYEEVEVNLPESWDVKHSIDSTRCEEFAIKSDINCIGSHVFLQYNFETFKDFVGANETPGYLKAVDKADDICGGYYLSYNMSGGGTTSSSSRIDEPPSFPTLYMALGICVLITYMVRRNKRSNSSY